MHLIWSLENNTQKSPKSQIFELSRQNGTVQKKQMSHLSQKYQNDDFQKAISRRDRSKTTPIFFQETSNGLIHPQIKYHHHIVTPLSPNRKKQ